MQAKTLSKTAQTHPAGRAMRITCVIHSLAGGGAERLMAGLAGRLSARHAVTLVTLDDSSSDRYPVDPAVGRIGLGLMSDSRNLMSALTSNRRRLKSLRDAVLGSKPDVVLSFCDKTNVLTLAALIRAPQSPDGNRRLPVVISEHTNPTAQPIGSIWSWLRRRLYPQAAGAIALTADAATTIRRWTKGNVTIIPPAIDTPEPQRQLVETGPFTWLCLGRLSEEKRFDHAIAAFDRMAGDFNCRLRIAGEGPLADRLRAQLKTAKNHEKIELLGWVGDVATELRAADGFLLTSAYEGFPVALLEAMAAGLACVSVDCPQGPAELIQTGANGLLVPQDDPTALSEAIRAVMADRQTAFAMGRLAQETASGYTWDRFASAHEGLLLSVC